MVVMYVREVVQVRECYQQVVLVATPISGIQMVQIVTVEVHQFHPLRCSYTPPSSSAGTTYYYCVVSVHQLFSNIKYSHTDDRCRSRYAVSLVVVVMYVSTPVQVR